MEPKNYMFDILLNYHTNWVPYTYFISKYQITKQRNALHIDNSNLQFESRLLGSNINTFKVNPLFSSYNIYKVDTLLIIINYG